MVYKKKLEVPHPSDENKQETGTTNTEVKAVAGSLKDLHMLEIDVAGSTNKEKLKEIGNNVPAYCEGKVLELVSALEKDPSKKIETFDKETLEWFDTFVGRRLVGSVYGKSLRACKNADGSIDTLKYATEKLKINVNTLETLKTSLIASGTEYDANEQRVINLLLSNDQFSKDYISERYAKVTAIMDKYVNESIDPYNQYLSDHPEEKEGGPNVRDKTKKRAGEHKGIVIAGGVGVSLLALHYLFRKKKKKNGDNKDDKNSDDDEGFWDSTFGKVVKLGGIGAVGFWLIKSLMDGKFHNPFANDMPNDKPKDQVDSYKKFCEDHPEEKERYEELGNSTDALYGQMFSKEIQSGGEDDAKMDTIAISMTGGREALKGVVPYCLDNQFGSTSDLLSESGQFSAMLSSGLTEIRGYISGRAEDKLKGLADSFLSRLPSWGIVGSMVGSTKEKIDTWLSHGDPAEREKELQLFFRQSVRVQTFLLKKREQLTQDIVQEKLTKNKDIRSVEKAMSDDERMKKNVLNDARLQSYDAGKISNASKILKEAGILDGTLTQDTKERIDALDETKKEIFGGEKDNELITMVRNGSIDEAGKKKLMSACDKINEEIDDQIIDAEKEKALNIFGDLFNTDEAAKRAFLEHCNFEGFFGTVKTYFSEVKEKLEAGTLTPGEAKEFQEKVNLYFMHKKELYTGAETLQVEQANEGSVTKYIIRGVTFMKGSFVNLAKAFTTFGDVNALETAEYIRTGSFSIILTGGVLSLSRLGLAGTLVTRLGTGILKAPIMPLLYIGNHLSLGRNIGVYNFVNNDLLRKTVFSGTEGPNKLMNAFKDGHITLEKAGDIIDEGKKSGVFKSPGVMRARESTFGSTGSGKYNILEKYLKGGPFERATAEEVQLIGKYFDKGHIRDIIKSGDPINTLAALKKIDAAMATARPDQAKDLLNLLKEKKLDVATIDQRIATIAAKPVPSNVVSGVIDDRKNVSALSAEQKLIHADVSKEIESLEKQAKTLGSAESKILMNEADALKVFAKELPSISKESATALMELSKDIKLNYLAKMAGEGADFSALAKEVKAMKADGIGVVGADLEHLLTIHGAPKFAEELGKDAVKLEQFTREFTRIAEDGAKIAKIEKVTNELFKIGEKLVKFIK